MQWATGKPPSGIGASWGSFEGLLRGVAGPALHLVFTPDRVVTVHATLLAIATTSPARVSTATITAAAVARPRRCRRASKIATAMPAKINAAYAASPTVSAAVDAALARVTLCTS